MGVSRRNIERTLTSLPAHHATQLPRVALSRRQTSFVCRALRSACGSLALVTGALGAQSQTTATGATGALDQSPLEGQRRTIAQALARSGVEDTVLVAGRATVSSGVLQSPALDIALDDGTAGVRVYGRLLRTVVKEGDSVEARGVVRLYRGNTELFATDARVVAVLSRPVVPEARRVQEVPRHEGRVVLVRGRVEALGRSEGGQFLRVRAIRPRDRGIVTVWVPASLRPPIDLALYEAGDVVSVTGLVTAYRDNPTDPVVWQLVPRRPADIVVTGIPRRWYALGAWLLAGLVLVTAAGFGVARVSTHRQRQALRETQDRYRQLLEMTPDAVIVHDRDGVVLFTNPAAARLLGVTHAATLAGRRVDEFLPAGTAAPLPPHGAGVMARAQPAPALPDASGLAFMAEPLRVRGQLVSDAGIVTNVELTASPCSYLQRPAVVLLARDIGAQLRYERDLHALALVDTLTGLYNRRGFTLLAEPELQRSRELGRTCAVLFADLDGLKRINDHFGHAAGDAALCAVAAALQSVSRESDVTARWSGDEFVMLIADGNAVDGDAAEAALEEQLLKEIRKHTSPDTPYAVTASFGLHLVDPATDESLDRALALADEALYRARGGRAIAGAIVRRDSRYDR